MEKYNKIFLEQSQQRRTQSKLLSVPKILINEAGRPIKWKPGAGDDLTSRLPGWWLGSTLRS